MALLLLEALLAGVILVAIVWWVMFAGRNGGERQADPGEGRPDGERSDRPPP